MYKRYISSIIIIIIIITEMDSMIFHIINNFRIPVRAKKKYLQEISCNYMHRS